MLADALWKRDSALGSGMPAIYSAFVFARSVLSQMATVGPRGLFPREFKFTRIK